MSYVQGYHKQVEEVFLDPSSRDPVSHGLDPGDWELWNQHQRNTALEPCQKGPYQELMATDTAAKLKGMEPWLQQVSQSWKRHLLTPGSAQTLETFKPNWEAGVEDIKLDFSCPRYWVMTSYFKMNIKPFHSFFPLTLTWKDNAIIWLSQVISNGSKLSGCCIYYQRFRTIHNYLDQICPQSWRNIIGSAHLCKALRMIISG